MAGRMGHNSVVASRAEMLVRGWSPFDYRGVAIRVDLDGGSPICQSCKGPQFIVCFSPGSGNGLGQAYRKSCGCVSGRLSSTSVEAQLDFELREAVRWFNSSAVPDCAFELCGRDVDDPAAFWEKLRSVVGKSNYYVFERHREELIGLKELFG